MTLTRLERPEIRRTSLLSQSLAITRRNPCLSREKFDLRGALDKDA